MAIQTINIGTVANDGTGDTVRDAFLKTNENFTDILASRRIAFGNRVKVLEAGEPFGSWCVPSDTTFLANLVNSVGGSVGTNFTSPGIFSLQNDGVEFGTITIASDGSVSAVSDATVAPAFSNVSIIQPAILDPSGADVTLTIVGNL